MKARVLARIAPRLVHPTGGLFALCAEDDGGYVEPWEQGIQAGWCLARRDFSRGGPAARAPAVPGHPPCVRGAGCRLRGTGPVRGARRRGAAPAGAEVRDFHRVDDFLSDGRGISGVRATDVRTGEAGAAPGQARAPGGTGPGAEKSLLRADLSLSLNLLRGAMVALDGPRLSTSVNRLQPPSDGDIALPRGRMNIAGTTSIPIEQPDDRRVDEREISPYPRARSSTCFPG